MMAALFKSKKRLGRFFQKGTIFIVLIAALGLLGVSYASWTQQFNIFSTISTGKINVDIIDVKLEREKSDGYESISFIAQQDGDDVVDEIDMNVVSYYKPYSAVLVFTVENNGTIPVTCTGVEIESVTGDAGDLGDLEVEIVDDPVGDPIVIDVGETEFIEVRITKSCCNDFKFTAFLVFEQKLISDGYLE
jgi:hypothetical protein